jgi:hypothetical protein
LAAVVNLQVAAAECGSKSLRWMLYVAVAVAARGKTVMTMMMVRMRRLRRRRRRRTIRLNCPASSAKAASILSVSLQSSAA